MKRILRSAVSLLLCAAVALGGTACGRSKLPTTITIWTYYNGDQLECFNQLVEQFNSTVGKEKNIRVESSSQGSVNDLETSVLAAAEGKVGAEKLPNIVSSYADTAFTLDQMGLPGCPARPQYPAVRAGGPCHCRPCHGAGAAGCRADPRGSRSRVPDRRLF